MSDVRSLSLRPDESSSSHAILKSMLLPDEQMIQTAKISNGIYWKAIAFLVMSFPLMVLILLFSLPALLALLFCVVLMIKVFTMTLFAYLKRRYLLLVVTDKRVIVRVGITTLEVIQIRYAQIESSEIASTIAGRYFGYSTVLISGTGGQTLAVPYIINAIEIRKSVTEILSHRDDVQQG